MRDVRLKYDSSTITELYIVSINPVMFLIKRKYSLFLSQKRQRFDTIYHNIIAVNLCRRL